MEGGHGRNSLTCCLPDLERDGVAPPPVIGHTCPFQGQLNQLIKYFPRGAEKERTDVIGTQLIPSTPRRIAHPHMDSRRAQAHRDAG